MKRFLTKKTMMDAPRPSGCERISATRTHIIITTMRMLIITIITTKGTKKHLPQSTVTIMYPITIITITGRRTITTTPQELSKRR